MRRRCTASLLLVSIHAPREGCDYQWGCSDTQIYKMFQFTHPGRGATSSSAGDSEEATVSIHAPREGCDDRPDRPKDGQVGFQFTHPGRGATVPKGVRLAIPEVSIHAPREGCDFAQ